MAQIIAIDAGTTGVRSLLIDESTSVVDVSYREHAQHYPSPGWVEHDAQEIWRNIAATLVDVASRRDHSIPLAAIGITNQRETVVAWDRATGEVLSPALVWQDKRTTDRCDNLRQAGHLEKVRHATGLVLDPYFSATKMNWLLESGRLDHARQLALGTVDSWVIWNLTGGTEGGSFVTDASNASRTLLYDLHSRSWSQHLCDLFGVPLGALADIKPSCGRFGTVSSLALEELRGTPVSGVLGDQQAALFGQACFAPGMVKATYGTGAFVLATTGPDVPVAPDGLLSTVAWDLGDHGGLTYALEGSAFVAGAAIQWLRDELGIITAAADVEDLARQAETSDGLRFIPAFVGLGSPWWDDSARGSLIGITRGSGRAQLARAVVDSLAFEVRAITDAMSSAAGQPLTRLRADGGAAAMNLLLAHQADQSRVLVERPTSLESTALGAATIAGLAEGVFSSLDDLATHWSPSASFVPVEDAAADLAYQGWLDALERSKNWV